MESSEIKKENPGRIHLRISNCMNPIILIRIKKHQCNLIELVDSLEKNTRNNKRVACYNTRPHTTTTSELNVCIFENQSSGTDVGMEGMEVTC
ncbi:LOW QUALITY PROTEIN: hypothetical protein OSB04_023302 [Centaurea solstitialis]|uniref:Uncharacterized protein n=1 Tax=Centaurea solstitialis TaxID=347529 RepID=A0AA38SWB2_9ASTR|nr:LOW QUALITY PROTEIN: hypothetical protein OSB04_023302 [Centaurea solstitialis]